MSDPATPGLSVEDVLGFYDSAVVIESFNRWFEGQWHTRVRPDVPGVGDGDELVWRWLEPAPGRLVLDFGCGVGVTACRLAQRSGCEVRGLNLSPRQVELANQLAARLGLFPRVRFDLYEGRFFPYPDASFDGAYFFESPCHVPHKPLLFRELWRVLRPGAACAGQDWVLTREDLPADERAAWIAPIETASRVELRSLEAYRGLALEAGFVGARVLDAAALDPGLARAFTQGADAPLPVGVTRSLAADLTTADRALSTAYHRGLFTVGFVHGRKPGADGARAQDPPTRLAGIDELDLRDFQPEANLATLARHQRAFGVPDSAALESLRGLVAGWRHCTLEASCKVEPHGRHAGRFNLFCHGAERARFLERTLLFFREVEQAWRTRLDRSPLERVLAGQLDADVVRKVVAGVDLRPEARDSRLKLWLMLRQGGGALGQALDLHGARQTFESLHLHDEVLVGFDLRGDGTTTVKLYPDVLPEELADTTLRSRLAGVLSPTALAAMDECVWTHLYLAQGQRQVVLQLHPADPDAFVERWLPVAAARAVHAVYDGARLLDFVAALPHDELGLAAPRTFVLYYMPRGFGDGS